jgi:hypothetical protein
MRRLLARLREMVTASKPVRQWLDEGWSPWRIGYGLVSVALTVAGVVIFAAQHHLRGLGWLLAAVAVVAVWALMEMLLWRIRHNRLQGKLDEAEARLNAPPAVEPGPAALQPHYEQSPPYRLPNEHMLHHRIGIRNPAGNPTAHRVRLQWAGMSPQPRIDLGYPPVTPQAVPMVAGGDPAIGISLPPGQEELWLIATTATDSEGTMTVGTFGPRRLGAESLNARGGSWDHGSTPGRHPVNPRSPIAAKRQLGQASRKGVVDVERRDDISRGN